jgi:hypothetical protein
MNVRPCLALRPVALAAAALMLALHAAPAAAVGGLADVQVVDRTTGETLPVHWHDGRWWVAGTPGNRYAVRLANPASSGRVLAVLSVDGVNAVTGETAAPEQSGYVLTAGSNALITGWRKDLTRVAAFEFTALASSYAARTGRPDNVGVIGVALFRERPRERPVVPPVASRETAPAPASRNEASADAAGAAKQRAAEAVAAAPSSPLGTGHGRSERSLTRLTEFERAQAAPDEIVAIHYDSRDNLIARGVLPRPRPQTSPNPFPAAGWVPDPR